MLPIHTYPPAITNEKLSRREKKDAKRVVDDNVAASRATPSSLSSNGKRKEREARARARAD